MRPCVIQRAAVLVGALMCVAAILPHVHAAEEEEVSVWMPSVAMAPATVQLSVRVAPRQENRLLRVSSIRARTIAAAICRSREPTHHR